MSFDTRKTKDSGGDWHDRRREANEILKMLESHEDELEARELGFLEDVSDPDRPITTTMIFWLRDIKDRLL